MPFLFFGENWQTRPSEEEFESQWCTGNGWIEEAIEVNVDSESEPESAILADTVAK